MSSLSRLLLLACLLASAPLSAQNLVQNGDFAQGTSSWQSTGSASFHGVVPFDCNGDGKSSPSFSVTPTSDTNPFLLTQSVPLVRGQDYWLRLDLRAEGLLQGNESQFEVFYGSSPFDRSNRIAQTKAHAGVQPMLLEVAGPFRVGCACTYVTLAFSLSKAANVAFRLHVDDVEIHAEAGLPWATCYTDRQNTPRVLGIRAYGRTGNFYVLVLGSTRLEPPLAIPGVLGQLELDPSAVWITMDTGSFNLAGTEGTTVNVPTQVYQAAIGLPLLWMPLEIDASPLTLGLGRVSIWSLQ